MQDFVVLFAQFDLQISPDVKWLIQMLVMVVTQICGYVALGRKVDGKASKRELERHSNNALIHLPVKGHL